MTALCVQSRHATNDTTRMRNKNGKGCGVGCVCKGGGGSNGSDGSGDNGVDDLVARGPQRVWKQ